jgi:hypothetical protein
MNGYTYIAAPGQTQLSLNATNNILNVVGANGITISTNPATNTLTIGSQSNFSTPDLVVTNSVVINPALGGTLDNITIGASTPKPGYFTNLTANSTISLSPANANVTISPTGSGSVTINPAVTGTINNVTIGATTAAAGSFTSLLASGGTISLTAGSNNITFLTTGSGAISITSNTLGSMNNVAIGGTTPAAGNFTTINMTSNPVGLTGAVTVQYAIKVAAALSVALS